MHFVFFSLVLSEDQLNILHILKYASEIDAVLADQLVLLLRTLSDASGSRAHANLALTRFNPT